MDQHRLPVYLDYHATTPVDHRVMDAMLPFFTLEFGNAASRSHPFGWRASEAVEMARARVADLIHVSAEEIFFTSGATESLNTAIKGIAAKADRKKHILTVSTEHHAVLDPLHWLSKKGFQVEKLPVDVLGRVHLQQMMQALRDDTLMVVIMWANNETGVIHDIKTIGKLCQEKNVAFICDATQATGKIDVDAVGCNVDLLALSSHKLYGPKGSGALYIARNAKKLNPEPLLHGGGHESGIRSGTLNVPGIVGLGKAAAICKEELHNDGLNLATLRDEFEKIISDQCEHVTVNGDKDHRLPSVSNIHVAHVDGQAVMTKLRTRISISSGSACSSADPSPSHVLLAMGLSAEDAKGSFRISFGRPTTVQEMRFAAGCLADAINEYRDQSPVWQMFKKGIDLREMT